MFITYLVKFMNFNLIGSSKFGLIFCIFNGNFSVLVSGNASEKKTAKVFTQTHEKKIVKNI